MRHTVTHRHSHPETLRDIHTHTDTQWLICDQSETFNGSLRHTQTLKTNLRHVPSVTQRHSHSQTLRDTHTPRDTQWRIYDKFDAFSGVRLIVSVCCGVLRCVAVCCSVLQCVAVCCSVLQCVAVCVAESIQSERSMCWALLQICQALF